MAKKQAEEATTQVIEEQQSTEVVKKEEGGGEVQPYGAYGEYAGAGFEDTTSEDYSIPFLTVLQALSPQVQGEAALEGAKPGMLFNTVTGELFEGKTGLEFVPAHRERVYVEWVPRDQGGGFVGRHEQTSEIVMKAKQRASDPTSLKTEAGNDLIDTAYVYGIICHEDGRLESVVLAFTSTKLKVYRHLMTKLRQFTVQVNGKKVNPPLFAYRLRVTTTTEKNKKGSFYNFKISAAEGSLADSLLSTEDERFQAAVSLRNMILSGTAQANYESQGAEGGGAGGDDVPF